MSRFTNTLPTVHESQVPNLLAAQTTIIEDYLPNSSTDNANTNTTHETKQQTSSSSPEAKTTLVWVFQMLSHLSGWITYSNPTHTPQTITTKDVENLLNDWEWIHSKTEELSIKQTERKANALREELSQIHSTVQTIKFQNFFKNVAARDLFNNLSEQDKKDLQSTLDVSKSSKIISDVVHHMEDKWLHQIHQVFFPNTSVEEWQAFEQSFKEKPYQRNVVGSLKELAFSASHGQKEAGINNKVLGEILWSLWKTLVEAIRSYIGRELTYNEFMEVAQGVAESKDHLAQLWINTVRNSRQGAQREGVVVQRWKQEKMALEAQRKQRIQQLGIDAKWDGFKRPTIQKDEVADVKKLRNILEDKLQFSFVVV